MVMPLLGPDEPIPYEVHMPEGTAPFILTCEHAGNRVPASLYSLGLPIDKLELHIGWDIGIAPVAVQIAKTIEAPLVCQPYSRLVIDCNRPPRSEEATPSVCDGVIVPGNDALSATERDSRIKAIHAPFHDMVGRMINRRQTGSSKPAVISLHSFTPKLETERTHRPWDITLLYNRDARIAESLEQLLRKAMPSINLAHNKPYTVADSTDYTIPVHGEQRGLPNVLIEIRNDHLLTETGQRFWAAMLSNALQQLEAF
ncbi:MAG: N-formylglutamate amidohydrolase [Alphaproteobacteria bacterium]